MDSVFEFKIPQELTQRGITRVAKEASTLVVEYNGTPVRVDIEKKC
jgi:hypothetical protein